MGGDDDGMFAHGLKIEGRVAVGDHRLDAADLRGDAPDAVTAADGRWTELLLVHDQQAGFVGEGADDGVGAVDDQPFAGLAQTGEKLSLRVSGEFAGAQRGDDMLSTWHSTS